MAPPQYSLSLDQFRQYAGEGNLVPLYREILADYETPVSAFAKIDHGPSAYLLESIEGGEKWARYSFLGSGSPLSSMRIVAIFLSPKAPAKTHFQPRRSSRTFKEMMEGYRPVTVPDLPRSSAALSAI